MTRSITVVIIFLTTLTYPLMVRAQTEYAKRFIELVSNSVSYSLVFIKVEGILPDNTNVVPIEASGFLITQDGHIVTSKHVVLTQTNWNTFRDRLQDQTPLSYAQINLKYLGKLSKDDAQSFSLIPVAVDDASDLAVLKITSWTETLRQKPWPSLRIAHLTSSSESLRVMAWGYPKQRAKAYLYGSDTGKITAHGVVSEGLILHETNLGLEPGTSGGLVFTLQGEIAGVIYGGRNLTNTTYIIPSNTLHGFLTRLGLIR